MEAFYFHAMTRHDAREARVASLFPGVRRLRSVGVLARQDICTKIVQHALFLDDEELDNAGERKGRCTLI